MSKAGLGLLAVLVLSGASAPQDEFAAAEKEFKAAIGAQIEKPLEDAIRKLVKINTPAAAKVILGAIKLPNSTSIYWMLVNGAATFGSPDALGEVTRIILANKMSPVSRD